MEIYAALLLLLLGCIRYTLTVVCCFSANADEMNYLDTEIGQTFPNSLSLTICSFAFAFCMETPILLSQYRQDARQGTNALIIICGR